MDDIIKAVTVHFQVKLSELQSRKRSVSVARPRQVAMYLARTLTRHSLEEIGGYFGGRDHSTVMHACDRVRQLLTTEPHIAEAVEHITAQLRNKR